jgi:hypothetical protein
LLVTGSYSPTVIEILFDGGIERKTFRMRLDAVGGDMCYMCGDCCKISIFFSII